MTSPKALKRTHPCSKLLILSAIVIVGIFCLGQRANAQTPWFTVLEQIPNPAVVTDAVLRQKLVDTGLPWRVQDIGTGIEMLLVPPGTFTMGTENGDDASRAHQVTLSQPFYLGKTEVTQAEWLAKMGSNPSYFKGNASISWRPVEEVSWNDIVAFNAATGLRLPTEAEWEYACRAGTTTERYSTGDIGWWGDRYNQNGGSHNVAEKVPNAYGFYDMLGNVSEWVQDWLGNYPADLATNPVGPISGTERVVRGGSWQSYSIECGASYRGEHHLPDFKDWHLGFRVARTASAYLSIAGVLPPSGPCSGGTAIRISGTNFPNPPTVTVGGVSASDITWVSPTLVTATTPPGVPGVATVSVGNTSAEAFYYRPECGSDLDQNGNVDGGDMAILLLDWGQCYQSQSASEASEPSPPPLLETPSRQN